MVGRRQGPRDHRLDPTVTDRVRVALRPGWTRSLAIRRILAIVLVGAAVTSAVIAHRGTQLATVMVAARDLSPGLELTATDLRAVEVDPSAVPPGALRMTRDGLGRTVTGPVHSGEILTDWRLLSTRLPALLTSDESARLVPVRLADDAVVDLLRTGDVVDVLTEADKPEGTGTSRDSGRVLVRGAVVAVVPGHAGSRDTRPPVVMLAMRERDAHAVAGTALAAPVTVVFH
ncbi:SAF domain-containing protein [Williamsia deligens]|uniref:SAF domain-containing protein n=1 Tax=Williamsia deligens TaxID=321325 RepID=A0ABW3GAL2_9NOCA|nr:SAF domain-containing protein [Williamsia deligens]MCP2192540.1 Flp pilus assembly protein CpaB [Williamsia deligens]